MWSLLIKVASMGKGALVVSVAASAVLVSNAELSPQIHDTPPAITAPATTTETPGLAVTPPKAPAVHNTKPTSEPKPENKTEPKTEPKTENKTENKTEPAPENKTEQGKGSSGIPFLSRIPVVGGLFGSQNQTNNREEVLVLITPTVVRDPSEARRLTDEYGERFRALDPMRKPSGATTPRH